MFLTKNISEGMLADLTEKLKKIDRSFSPWMPLFFFLVLDVKFRKLQMIWILTTF